MLILYIFFCFVLFFIQVHQIEFVVQKSGIPQLPLPESSVIHTGDPSVTIRLGWLNSVLWIQTSGFYISMTYIPPLYVFWCFIHLFCIRFSRVNFPCRDSWQSLQQHEHEWFLKKFEFIFCGKEKAKASDLRHSEFQNFSFHRIPS